MRRPAQCVRRSPRAIALLAVMTFALSGCSDDALDANPYAEDMAAAREGAVSDFEREAFADGALTREEYQRAHELWLLCMEQTFPPDGGRAVSLILGENGLYQYGATGFDLEDEEFYDSVHESCAEGTIATIAPLYGSMTVNPAKLDVADLLAECLVRTGTVPEWYTAENLRADMGSAENGDAVTGLDLESEGFRTCVANPQSGK